MDIKTKYTEVENGFDVTITPDSSEEHFLYVEHNGDTVTIKVRKVDLPKVGKSLPVDWGTVIPRSVEVDENCVVTVVDELSGNRIVLK